MKQGSLPIIVVLFSAREIHALNFSKLQPYFPSNPMLCSRQQLKPLFNRFVIGVSDYDSDPREIFEIPEIRKFYSELCHRWPNWLYYMAVVPEAVHAHIAPIILCRVDSLKVTRKDGASVCLVHPGNGEFGPLLGMDLMAMFALSNYAGIPKTIQRTRTEVLLSQIHPNHDFKLDLP